MSKKFLANRKNQDLNQHLYAIGYLSKRIAEELFPEGDTRDSISKMSLIAGLWHDMGKLDPKFQNWAADPKKSKKINWEDHPRHNEISFILFESFCEVAGYNPYQKDSIAHAIFWHHSKPIRKKDFNPEEIVETLEDNLSEEELSDLLTGTFEIISDLTSKFDELSPIKDQPSSFSDFFQTSTPLFKNYFDTNYRKMENYRKVIHQNAKEDILRAIIVSADQKVSSLSAEKLNELIENNNLDTLLSEIFHEESKLSEKINKFSSTFKDESRNKEQTKVVEKLIKRNVGATILEGPAGCGKTKISLEWAAKTGAQKIYWICPRVQVCQGIYEELKGVDAKVELLTGNFKKTHTSEKEYETDPDEYFGGDIVITTIDQIMNSVITHKNVTALLSLLNSHVIFDEFHELIKIKGINFLFAEIVRAKSLREESANLLLVSATINPLFVDKVLYIDPEDIISSPTFNQNDFEVDIKVYGSEVVDPISGVSFEDSNRTVFVITETATSAQLGFINNQNENSLLFHSKLKNGDKSIVFNKITETFKNGGTQKYKVLRSGPIIQSSLNISCEEMHTEITCPENWVQRLGRLNRFGEKEKSLYVTHAPENPFENKIKYVLGYNSKLCTASSWTNWLALALQSKGDSVVKLDWVYEQYHNFYKNIKESVYKEMMGFLNQSSAYLAGKKLDPKEFKSAGSSNEGRLKKESLRGENLYVKMAEIEINEDKEAVTTKSVFSPSDENDLFTISLDEIERFSEDSLILNMFNNHEKIAKSNKVEYKKPYNVEVMKAIARGRDNPIFLSYSYSNLKSAGMNAHPRSIYYAHIVKNGQKQIVGAISKDKL